MTNHPRTALRAVATLALAGGALLVAATANAAAPPQPPSSLGIATDVTVPKGILDAKFLDQHGTAESLAALKGKTVLLVPLLTLCQDTCPFTSGNLLQLDALLAKAKDANVVLVTISVDPYRDSVKRLAAYAKLIGATFELWTETGTTTKPVAPPHYSGKGSVGAGDTNAILTRFEHFFGWTVQVVKEGTPVAHDWMAPHEKLWYDINHSDGFWIVSANEVVRFESGDKPHFRGKLARALVKFLSPGGKYVYRHPYKGWTPKAALGAIAWVQSSPS